MVDPWATWETDPKVWLLMSNAYPPDVNHETIADVTAYSFWELDIPGYARQPLTGAIRADLVDVSRRYQETFFGAHGPAWSGLAGDDNVLHVVLAINGADDASSPLIGRWDVDVLTALVPSFQMRLGPWMSGTDPLPGGDANTYMVHELENGW
jgi:hypothetical protein